MMHPLYRIIKNPLVPHKKYWKSWYRTCLQPIHCGVRLKPPTRINTVSGKNWFAKARLQKAPGQIELGCNQYKRRWNLNAFCEFKREEWKCAGNELGFDKGHLQAAHTKRPGIVTGTSSSEKPVVLVAWHPPKKTNLPLFWKESWKTSKDCREVGSLGISTPRFPDAVISRSALGNYFWQRGKMPKAWDDSLCQSKMSIEHHHL
jgi:hypothetical protein